jgi:ATP-dependent helicase/DNAse subunit B
MEALFVHPSIPALQQAQRRQLLAAGNSGALGLSSSAERNVIAVEGEREASTGCAVEGASVALGYGHLLHSELLELLLLPVENKPRTLSRMGRYLLVQMLLQDPAEGPWHFMEPLMTFRGFLDLVVDLIEELQEGGLEPDDLMRTLLGEPRGERDENAKNLELSRLYGAYEKRLAALSAWDRAGRKRRALEFLAGGGPHPILDSFDEIHFQNVYRLSYLDFLIITRLCTRSLQLRPERPVQVFVHLPYDPQRQDAFRYLDHLVRLFENLGEDAPSNLNLDFTMETSPAEASSSREYLLAHLFRSPEDLLHVAPLQADETIRIISAPGPEGEATAICRELRSLLERGVEPSRIAVAFRGLAAFAPALRQTGDSFSLPLIFTRGESLVTARVIRSLLAPFHLLNASFSANEVLKFLNSTYLSWDHLLPEGSIKVPADARPEGPIEAPVSSCGLLAPGDLEAVVAAAGVLDDESVPWEPALKKLMANLARSEKRSCSTERIERTAGLILDLIGHLREAFDLLPRRGTVQRFVEGLRSLIVTFRIRENVMRPCPVGGARALDIFRRDMSAFEEFEDLLEDLERTARALKLRGSLDRQEFYDLLVEGIKERTIPAPAGAEGIAVYEAGDLVGLETDYLFIGGLGEGRFPARHFENVLLRDSEKEILSRAAGRRIFLGTAMRQWEENLLFYLAVASARKALYLSHAASDEEDNAVLPSYFLENARKLLDNPPLIDGADGLDLRDLRRSADLDGFLVRGLFRPSTDRVIAESLSLLSAYLDKGRPSQDRLLQLFGRCAVENLRQEYQWTGAPEEGRAYCGALDDGEALERVLARWGEDHVWTASQLESYGRCPFVFFMRNVLGVEKRLLPEMEVDPTAEGTLAHDILQHFFEEMRQRKLLPLRKDPREREVLLTTAQRVFAKWEEEKITGEPHFWEIRKRGTLSVLTRWLRMEQDDPSFVPVLCEEEFGPCALPVEGTVLYFRGRIDRIDVDGGGTAYRVLDYKNSRDVSYVQKLKPDKIGKQNFQIPLYALAAKEILQSKNLLKVERPQRLSGYGLLKKPVITVQRFASDDLVNYFVIEEEDRAALPPGTRTFASDASRVVGLIRAGRFEPRGLECRHCDYDHLCRFRFQGEEEE